MEPRIDRTWRLLPTERVQWRGGPTLGVPRDLRWTVGPGLFFALAIVTALFAGLLYLSGIPAVRSTAFTAFYLMLTGISIRVLPQYLLDPCEYMLTDRQVIWKRGSYRRTMDRTAITYARIHWHRSIPNVGHLELVRAVPFGPLARRQRLWLHDVEAPDILFSLIRAAHPTEFAGYSDVRITDRLDRGERVLWGAGPAGYRVGSGEVATAIGGAVVLVVAALYAHRTAQVLIELEHLGLPVRSMTWALLFSAILISGSIIASIGAWLLWHGIWGARSDGSKTEYVLTNERLIIRRGLTELSLDRKRIVDVAELPSGRSGLHNVHLILDAPDARALEDSGALRILSPARATVPPVLYEVQDTELLRSLLLARPRRDSDPPLDNAA
jgi:hypothetical protein